MELNTVSRLMGWTWPQWRAAFEEQGLTLTAEMRRSAVLDPDGLDVFVRAQEAWEARHAFDPLESPIVVAEVYRVRAAAC